jgi:hypothetical protein
MYDVPIVARGNKLCTHGLHITAFCKLLFVHDLHFAAFCNLHFMHDVPFVTLRKVLNTRVVGIAARRGMLCMYKLHVVAYSSAVSRVKLRLR